MHLAPARRRLRWPPLLIVPLLLATGCMLDAPRPSPPVCPPTDNGCGGSDAPWYRQNVTELIPPPPVEAPAPAVVPELPAAASPTPPATSPGIPPGPATDPTMPPSSTLTAIDGARAVAGAPPAVVQAVPDAAAVPAGVDAAAAPASDPPPSADAPPSDVKVRQSEDMPDAVPEPATRNIVSVPSDALFAVGQARLGPSGRAQMDALADRIHGTPYERILVVARTDRTGKALANLKLSWLRARAVRDHLESRGIPSTALDYEGRGARDAHIDPARCGGPRSQRLRCLAPDRRIDIVITGQPIP